MNTEAGSAIEGNPFKAGDVVQLKSGGPVPWMVTLVRRLRRAEVKHV